MSTTKISATFAARFYWKLHFFHPRPLFRTTSYGRPCLLISRTHRNLIVTWRSSKRPAVDVVGLSNKSHSLCVYILFRTAFCIAVWLISLNLFLDQAEQAFSPPHRPLSQVMRAQLMDKKILLARRVQSMLELITVAGTYSFDLV